MAQVDLTGFEYFLPLLSFLVVLIISFFILQKTKLIENKFFQVAISFILAIIFVTAAGPRLFILTIIPWFAIIIVGMFLVWVLLGFLGKPIEGMSKPLGTAFVVLLCISFVVSFVFVFSNYFAPYLPWNLGVGANPEVLVLTNYLTSPKVAGSILLIIVGVVAGWVLVKAK